MKDIGAVTIGKLIEAHYEKDEHKFKAYAEFIAEAYKERGEERAERIIRSKIDGSYKNKPVAVTLDKEIKENDRRLKPIDVSKYTVTESGNVIRTDNKETLKNALERITELEIENAELRAIAENQQSSNMERYFKNKELEKENAVLKKKNSDEECLKRLAKKGYIKFCGKANEWHNLQENPTDLPKCEEDEKIIFCVKEWVESVQKYHTHYCLGFYKKAFLNEDVKLFVERSKGYENEHLPKSVLRWLELEKLEKWETE